MTKHLGREGAIPKVRMKMEFWSSLNLSQYLHASEQCLLNRTRQSWIFLFHLRSKSATKVFSTPSASSELAYNGNVRLKHRISPSDREFCRITLKTIVTV